MEPNIRRVNPKFSEQELWERYLAVTEDLLKFIKEEDIDTFLSLVDQRHRLMEMLQEIPWEQQAFRQSPAGQAILNQIKPMDMQIGYRARTWLNKSRRNNVTVRAYDMTGYSPAGNVFNKEY